MSKVAPHVHVNALEHSTSPHGDGDKLASPDSIEKHLEVAAEEPKSLASGASHVAADDESSASRRISTVRIVLLTAVMLLTWFLNTASVASVTLLLPVMVADLRSDPLQIQWVVSAYTLAFGCGLLFSGRLADIYGRRKLYLIGILAYLVFTAITGGLRNRIAICFMRAFAGLGLATAIPSGFGIVGTTVRHEPARTIVFAMFGLGTPAGAFLGSLICGGLSTLNESGWSYFFFALAGVSAVVLALAWFVVPADAERRHGADKRVDWIGGVIVTAAICLLPFSLTDSGITPRGWSAPHVPALLATSIVLFVLFFFWSRHLETKMTYPPIIKISLFTRHRGRIGVMCIAAFFASTSVYSWVFLTANFYQGFMGLTPWGNAVKILTSNITGIIVMLLAPRVKAPYILACATIASGICGTLMAVRPAEATFWRFEFPAQLLFPWGHDLTMTIGNIIVSNLADDEDHSVAGALFQTLGQIGGSLGICLSALISSEISQKQGGILPGLRSGYWYSASTSFLVTVLLIIGLRGVGLAKDVRHCK